MKIGVMSDTHGKWKAIEQAMRQAGSVEAWFHLGDYSQDGFRLAQSVAVPVTTVQGNCDGTTEALVDEFVEWGGVKFWLTHGHRYGVKYDLADLVDWAKHFEVTAVLFGHTHEACAVQRAGIWLINPGSLALPNYGAPTVAILDISNQGQLKVQHLAIAM